MTDTVPIVMVGHADPIRYGLVANLARPENNITGVSFLADELEIGTRAAAVASATGGSTDRVNRIDYLR